MVCIYCGGDTAVTNSRKTVRLHATWRRRRCKLCGAIFTSSETLDLGLSIMVEHKDAALHPFNRDQLFVSIYESCRHRKNAFDDASALTQTIINKLLKLSTAQQKPGLIPQKNLTDTALQVLGNFDKVAATYYAAYYVKEK